MDSRSFDRLARLLGGATDRRAGLKAALGLLLGGAAADAAAKGRGTDRDRKRGNKDRANADAAPDAGTDLDAAKKKKRCKAIGGRCKKQQHCCAGTCVKPTNNKGKPAKKGICLCVNEGGACATVADCCIVGSAGVECRSGICTRLPVATGQACVEGDACADPDAACTFYRRDESARTAATLCLLGGGAACVKDQDCIDLQCTNGTCGGRTVIDTGEACVPDATICRDLAASCRSYQSAIAPEGDYCLLPDGEPCRSDAQCRDLTCQDGYCGRQPVDTGKACDARVDTCRNHRATCTTYASGGGETRCLLGDGETCAASAECIIEDCREGTCQGGPTLVATGEPCSTDPAVNRCLDDLAECLPYRSGTGGPAGTHCVLPDGASCEFPNECALFSCPQETCAPTPIPTGEPCRKGLDVCDNPRAECTVYANGDDPTVTHCLLPNGDPCGSRFECEVDLCVGVCGNCRTDAQCGNGVCAGNICRACTVDTGIAATNGMTNPAGITFFEGRVWVANHAYSNPSGKRVSFFDPANPAAVTVGAQVANAQFMDVAGRPGIGGSEPRLFVANFDIRFSGIYEVDTTTGNVSASRWSGEIRQPYGLVFDGQGDAWVATSYDGITYANAVYKVTTAPNGDATATTLAIPDVCGPRLQYGQPRFMATGPGGWVYLACDGTGPGQGTILAWNPAAPDPAANVVRVTGDRVLGSAFGIAFRGNEMFVSNFGGQEIARYQVSLDEAGTPSATPGCVYNPEGIGVTVGISFDASNQLWVSDFNANLVAPTFNFSNAG